MGEKMTPDSTKSTQQKLKEGITDTMDKTARYASSPSTPRHCPPSNLSTSGVQPDHDKSASQSMMDKTGRASDREVHGSTAESMYVDGYIYMEAHC